MAKHIIVGEVLTGFDHYSQRIDDFKKAFPVKMEFIAELAQSNSAKSVIIGGIKERVADLENLPTVIKAFYQADFFVCGIHKKRTPIRDVLVAANCINDNIDDSMIIVDDAKDIPSIILESRPDAWIIFTGMYPELIPMESIIKEAVDEGRILGIITNSLTSDSKIHGVHVVTPLLRTKIDSAKPTVLLIDGKEVTRLEVGHDEHIFEFNNPGAGEVVVESSEFVRRLKVESDAIRDETMIMDSHRNLAAMIENSAQQMNISTVAKEIVNNLMTHTNR
jgi:hypothetical protein